MANIHYQMTHQEHVASRGSYVDPDRYIAGHRDYQPEMLCHTGDGHAKGTRVKADVTCHVCLEALMTPEQKAIRDLAGRIKADGFRPFIAEKGTYGFYTDAEGTRVVSFELNFGSPKFSGNYTTDWPQSTGTGWQLEHNSFATMFNAEAPAWAHQGAKWRHTKLVRHLATCGSSSRYTEYKA